MKKRWILFAICLIAHTGLSLWLVTSGQFPKGYLYFFLVFFPPVGRTRPDTGPRKVCLPVRHGSVGGTEFVLPLPC